MSEWLDILLRLWTSDDEFDYEGALIDVRGAYQQPKPVQRPRPPLMSAAFSPRGLAVAARYADMVFVDSTDATSVARRVADVRGLAQTQGRHISAWIAVSIICADTDAEAERRLVHYRENGDEDAIRNFVNWTLGGTQAVGDSVTKIGASLASAGGAYSLHGSPRTIADGLAELAVAGLDGVVLTFPNYDAGLPVFISDVLPLLEKDGVRAPRNAA
jgi:alkanesulfonate monooxygenase SsuD/methylene tetrahydromethanopterin reductase-like flavin-dependent oxidoreductase (luciferase family)